MTKLIGGTFGGISIIIK